jgi:prepilin-type N-terminal cleavage/methylation domain-containing protein
MNARATNRRRTGFTLVELLVVITIVGMLMAIIFPALGAIQEAGRKTVCQSNLSQITKAMGLFESNEDGYPGLVEAVGGSKQNPRGTKVTWAINLLQYLGRKDQYKTWESPPGQMVRVAGGQQNQPVRQAQEIGLVGAYNCPSDPPEAGQSEQPLAYVVNAGSSQDAKRPNPRLGNGVFFNRYMSSKDARPTPRVSLKRHILNGSGAQYTLMLAENIQAWNYADKRTGAGDPPKPYDGNGSTAEEAQRYTGFIWDGLQCNQGKGNTRFDEPSEAPSNEWARPSSKHPEGFFVAFCGNNTKWISSGIRHDVYQRLCASNVNNCDLPPQVKSYGPKEGDF